MLSINGKQLTNEEVVKLLEKETGNGKMKGDIEFCLLDNYRSTIKTLNDQGEVRFVSKYQATYAIANQYDRRNFTDGGTETIIYYTNVVNDKTHGQPRYMTNDLNKVVFYHGHLTVRPGQEDLLLFLRLNERNQTNPYWEVSDGRGNQKYIPQGAFNYKEIVPEKISEVAYDSYYEGLKAQAAVVNPDRIPYDMALKMAISYNMVDARFKGEKAIRLFLAQKAKENPESFMKDLNSSQFELRAQVNSCFMYGILGYDAPYIRWANKKISDADTRILTVPSGKDHVDYMVFWLREVDKSGVLNELRTQLERMQLKEHGIEVTVTEKEHNTLLKQLGVASLEEAAAIIQRSKNSEPLKAMAEDIAGIIGELGTHTASSLAKIDKETLQAVAKHFGIKGAHLFKEDKLAETILKKAKGTVVSA